MCVWGGGVKWVKKAKSYKLIVITQVSHTQKTALANVISNKAAL